MCCAHECLPPIRFLTQARFRVTAREQKNKCWANIPALIPSHRARPVFASNRAVKRLSGNRPPFLCAIFFPPRIFPFTPNDTLLSFLSLPSPLLTFFTPSLPVYLDALPPSFLSLGVTRPIWAVWWSWEHRSLSGELSGALLKTQRADYCSCQSH